MGISYGGLRCQVMPVTCPSDYLLIPIIMKHHYIAALLLVGVFAVSRAMAIGTVHVYVDNTRLQHITGFGAAAMSGPMAPIQDVSVIDSLYGPQSPVGLNILRMEISPNLIGDVITPWDTPYDWHGYLPVVKRAKSYGAIIFGAPWSPPAVYKTNNSNLGSTDNGKTRGKLKRSCYDKFFRWLNKFCNYMKNNHAAVDVVSLQNEPDWSPGYSGCFYTPEDLDTLVAGYANLLDKDKYGIKLMSGEALGYTYNYYKPTIKDTAARKYIDILGGHLYGHAPLKYMVQAASEAFGYGIESWMTEHVVDPRSDTDGDSQSDTKVIDLPTWHEQLEFAEEVNEVMQAFGSAYVYWYMVSHYSFIGSGEKTIQPGNVYGKVLDRGRIMGQFAKNLTGSTRLKSRSSVTTPAFESSAYIKGDSLIVMAIDTTRHDVNCHISLPLAVSSCKLITSTEGNLCQATDVNIEKGTTSVKCPIKGRSINTFVFRLATTGITESAKTEPARHRVDVYSLTGTKICQAADEQEAIARLSKGIYIIGGRKIAVK